MSDVIIFIDDKTLSQEELLQEDENDGLEDEGI